MSAVIFSPRMLNQLDLLKEQFFSGKEELSKITQFSRKDKPVLEPYFNHWQITWILITAPFNAFYSIFLKATAFLCAIFMFRSLSNRLYLQAIYANKEFWIVDRQLYYGKQLAVPTFNDYQEGLEDVYNHNPIKREDIRNRFIKERLDSRISKISFNRIGKGLCHGAVYWFNFLFLKSLNTDFEDRVDTLWQYLTPIAKQFEKGQPRQAALLQSLYGLRHDFLNLHEVCTRPLQEVDLTDRNKAIKAIKNLPSGVFTLHISEHNLSYIKLNGEECIWDPNEGLIIIEKPEDLLEIFLRYSKNRHGNDLFLRALSLDENHFLIPRNLTNTSEVLNKINQLPEGVFTLKISNTVMPYIKYHAMQCIVDPNGELIPIQKPGDLLKVFFKYTHNRWRSSIALIHHSFDEVLISPIPFDLTKTEEVLAEIKNLPDGFSLIEISNHKIFHLKHKGKESVWSPTEGLTMIEKPEDLLQIFLKYTHNKKRSGIIFAPATNMPIHSHWIKQWVNPLAWLGIH